MSWAVTIEQVARCDRPYSRALPIPQLSGSFPVGVVLGRFRDPRIIDCLWVKERTPLRVAKWLKRVAKWLKQAVLGGLWQSLAARPRE
jgi:hypothetical protein